MLLKNISDKEASEFFSVPWDEARQSAVAILERRKKRNKATMGTPSPSANATNPGPVAQTQGDGGCSCGDACGSCDC